MHGYNSSFLLYRRGKGKLLFIYSFPSASFTRLRVSSLPIMAAKSVPPPGVRGLAGQGNAQMGTAASRSSSSICSASAACRPQRSHRGSSRSGLPAPAAGRSGPLWRTRASFSASCCGTARHRLGSTASKKSSCGGISSSTSQRGCKLAQSRSRSISQWTALSMNGLGQTAELLGRQGADVGGVDSAQLQRVKDGGRLRDAGRIPDLDHFIQAEDLLLALGCSSPATADNSARRRAGSPSPPGPDSWRRRCACSACSVHPS